MTLVSIQNRTKSFGSRLVIGPVTWTNNEDARIGLVGTHGAGKSTLLRIIGNLEQPDAGKIMKRRKLRLLYLPQNLVGDRHGVLATAIVHRSAITNLEAQLRAVEEPFVDPKVGGDGGHSAALLDPHMRLLECPNELGGSRLHNETVAYLRALGITDDVGIPTRYWRTNARVVPRARRSCLAPAVVTARAPQRVRACRRASAQGGRGGNCAAHRG